MDALVASYSGQCATSYASEVGTFVGALQPIDGRYEIRAIPWSQLIRAARARHEHLQKWLDLTVSRDKMLALADESYAEFLPKATKKKKPPR